MVRPPPGVSSGVRVPPIASVRPRDRARPRPTPVWLSRSPRRWKGWKTRSWASGARPGPRSIDADLHLVAVFARGDQDGRAVADGVAHQVDQHPFQQRRVGDDLREVVGDRGLDVDAQRAQVVDGAGDDLVHGQRFQGHAQHAGLQAAHVEQVGHQAVEFHQRLVCGGQEFAAVFRRPRDLLAAQRLHRRFGRGQRGAQVVADRGQQRGAHLVGGRQRFRLLGGFGQTLLAQRHRDLGGEGLQDAAVGGVEERAARRQDQVVVDDDVGVAGRRVRRSGGPPVVAMMFQVLVSGARSSRVTRRQAEGLPQPRQQRRQGRLAAQHVAGQGRQDLGVGAGLGRLPGSPCRQVQLSRPRPPRPPRRRPGRTGSRGR